MAMEPWPGIRSPGDLSVNRQRAEQRHANEQKRRDGRQRTRGEQRNSRLVTERGKVVHAGQPENHVPGMRAVVFTLLEASASEKPPGHA